MMRHRITYGWLLLGRYMPSALQKKVQPTGPLADIVGSKKLTRGEITKKLWAHIKKNDLQGSLEDGDTCKYGGKTYKGGQVIFCETDEMYDLCGKEKIAMTELTAIANKYIK